MTIQKHLIIPFVLLLCGCGTTMPRKDKIWMQERILLSDPLGARALLTSIAVGCVGSGGSLIDCEGIHSPELKDIICGTVTRKYNGIESSEIYNHILRTLIENNFQILESDGDVGRIYSRYEKGIVKKFLIWEWKQRYTVICELRPKLTNPADVYFIYNFNVKEKPPLTSEYVPIVSDKNAQEIKNSLLSSVDQFVINKGGSF